MKAARFDYARARSLAHAVELLGSGDGFVKLLAGGQTLAPMLNLRLVRPDLLVDVSKLSEMTVWREEGGAILIGAGITHAAIADGKLPRPTGRVLARLASGATNGAPSVLDFAAPGGLPATLDMAALGRALDDHGFADDSYGKAVHLVAAHRALAEARRQ